MEQTWNYRVLSQKSGDETVYSIHQVFYDEQDIVVRYVKVPISLIATDLEDMVEDMQLALEAFDQPIIKIETLNNL
jgi:GTP:adenosylcobinamide-phosphate guanylyltransferase